LRGDRDPVWVESCDPELWQPKIRRFSELIVTHEGLLQPRSTQSAAEAYLFIASKWGRIELGDEDGAMPKTAIHAPGIGLGQLDSDYDQFTTESIQDLAAPFYVAASEKATKITCYTPRYLRLQVGVSYTPQIDQSRNVIAWRTDPSNFLEGGINDVTEIGDVNDLPDGLGQDQPARPTTTVGIFRGGQQNQRIMKTTELRAILLTL